MDQEATIISVKEARKILGAEYNNLPDSEVETIINDLEFMAQMALKHLKSPAVPPSTVGGFQMQKNNDN